MTYSASNIAKIIVNFSDPEKGDVMTNLKLQKLLYYAQGAFLSIFDKKLFEENMEAWQYGPVVPEVYHEYKENQGCCINPTEDNLIGELPIPEQELLKEVYNLFGQYSALRLMEMTHRETPWQTAGMSEEINLDLVKEYFTKNYLNA